MIFGYNCKIFVKLKMLVKLTTLGCWFWKKFKHHEKVCYTSKSW